MEQHLYSYLNTKYGLKQLITRDVDACLDAVRRFSAEDNDVATFGAILRNEEDDAPLPPPFRLRAASVSRLDLGSLSLGSQVDEPFRLVQRQLKETVRALLTAHLKGRHPHKSDAQVESAVLATARQSLLTPSPVSRPPQVASSVLAKTRGVVQEEEWRDVVLYMHAPTDSAPTRGRTCPRHVPGPAGTRPRTRPSSSRG